MTTRIATILERAAHMHGFISAELKKARANELRLLRLQRLLLIIERRLHEACRSTGLLPDDQLVIPVKAAVRRGIPPLWASRAQPY
jgi:hypothetical protein